MQKINRLMSFFMIGIIVTLMFGAVYKSTGTKAQVQRVDVRQENSQYGNKTRFGRPARTASRSFSRDDVIMLARAVYGEARGESFEGQVAVAAVIINRTSSKHFPGTIDGVVFEPGAFDAVSDGQIWLQPDEKSVRAAELALSGYDPTGDALFYWNPAKTTNRWIWSRPIVKKIGDHVFAK